VTPSFDLHSPSPPGGDAGIGLPIPDPGAHFDLRRADTRIEPVIGFVLPHGIALISLQPYFVVSHGAVRYAECIQQCAPGAQLLDFSQNWGLAAAVTLRTP